MRLLAVLAIVACGCSVDRRSEGLACTTSATCSDGRVCQQGYCVVGMATQDGSPSPDALVCPSICQGNDCNLATRTCNITGSGGAVTCPAGWNCGITCPSDGACASVDCTDAASCTVTCSAIGACGSVQTGSGSATVTCSATTACGNIVSGTGALDLTCTGTVACGAVQCTSSCQCDVSCSSSAACGMNSCPIAPGGQSCSKTSGTGVRCDSTVKPQCHHC